MSVVSPPSSNGWTIPLIGNRITCGTQTHYCDISRTVTYPQPTYHKEILNLIFFSLVSAYELKTCEVHLFLSKHIPSFKINSVVGILVAVTGEGQVQSERERHRVED